MARAATRLGERARGESDREGDGRQDSGRDRRASRQAPRGDRPPRCRAARRERSQQPSWDLPGEPARAASSRPRRGAQIARGLPLMKCREMVELMTDYLEGALSARDRARFEEHIAGCDGCRAYLEQMRTTMHLVGRILDEPIPEQLQQELVHASRTWTATPA